MTLKIGFLFALLSFITACGHTEKNVPSKPETGHADKITQFVQQNQFINVPNTHDYSKYLTSVSSVYQQAGKENQFDLYLQTLSDNFKAIDQTIKELPALYQKEKGKKADLKSSKFKLFKTKTVTAQVDKLNQERFDFLRSQLGEETFAKLLENNKKFADNKEIYPL
ncbi:MAG TPA: hypothetical protein VNJ08_08965 [Bacteriovoracaceae bacterium]|nr:hypothetical protein [Bacteriovoracaceae bacterium]